MFKIHKNSLMLAAAAMGFSLIAAAGLLAANWPLAAQATDSSASTDFEVFNSCWLKTSPLGDCATSDFDGDGAVGVQDFNLFKDAIETYDLNGDGMISLATSTAITTSDYYNVFSLCWWKDSTSSDWSSCSKTDFDGDNFIGPNDDNLFKTSILTYDLNGDGVVNTSTEELQGFKIMTQSDSGDYIGQNKSWDFSNSNNSKITVTVAAAGNVAFKTEDFSVSYMSFGFASETGKTLSPGLYTPAKRLPFRGSYNGVEISGDGRGCNTILGAFYVHEYVLNNGTLEKAAIDFVQICEPKTADINTAGPKLLGSIRYNSSVPDSCNSQGCAEAAKNVGIISKPDLVITDLKIDRMASWDPETLKYIWASFKNLGGAVSGKQNVKIRVIDSASNEVYSNYMVFDNNLTSGFSGTFSMNMPVKNLYSTHNLKAEIDIDNTIAESNENNNTLTKTITIANQGNPDLVIESVAMEYDKLSDSVKGKATIKNIGDKDAVSIYSFVGLRIIVNDDSYLFNWESLPVDVNRIFLKAGESKEYAFTIKTSVLKENYNNKIIFHIDRNNAPQNTAVDDGYVYESNENNNTLTKYLFISALSGMRISEINGLKNEFYQSEKVKIKIKALDSKNEAGTLAKGFNVVVYTYTKNEQRLENEGTAFGNLDGGYWIMDYTAPSQLGDYYIVISYWCSVPNSFCRNSPLDNNQIDKKHNFKVVKKEELPKNDDNKNDHPKDDVIERIKDRAKDLFENKFEAMRAEIKELRDLVREQQTQIKYLVSLKKDVKQLSEKVESAINNFITYGVDDNTKKLGEGERAAVMHSFKSAFNKLPETEDELSDAIKIANGRWPSMTSEEAEKEAKKQFEKIYKHIADMDNAHDNAAITVMAYGLRQKAENRNLNSETQGIKIFKDIYGHVPSSTEDWNIMQAITYSGASRGADTDGDLLLDEREIELGTDPNNPDTDGDGYKDGEEVANGFDPLK